MDYNDLKIRLFEDLQAGSVISFSTKEIATNITSNYTFTFVTTRSAPFEITAPAPTSNIGEASSLAFKNAVSLDMPDFLIQIIDANLVSTDFKISYIYNILNVSITFNTEDFLIFNADSEPASYNVLIPLGVNDIVVSGLNNDNYLINNEIWVEISQQTIASYFTIKVRNLTNQKETLEHKLYIISNKTSFNLQPLIKSLFDGIGTLNVNKFSITISSGFNSVEIQKFFVRGGNRTEKTNQFLNPNTILRNSVNLPIWSGYETNEYFINSNSEIVTRLLDDVINKEQRREKSCNSIYFKFLNQKGGYSNWLFETYKISQDNKPLGSYYSGQKSVDLGSEVDFDLQVYGKIPKEYIGIIKDLFVSPEVYYLKNGEWIRIYNAKNSIEEDENKKAYAVQGKFGIINRFNPSVLWSN